MYGDGVKYPQTVSKYWIQAGASLRILNTGLVKYPKSIRVSMLVTRRGDYPRALSGSRYGSASPELSLSETLYCALTRAQMLPMSYV